MEDGKPLRFKATIDVKPEVTLGEYKGLEVTKQVARVTNADVERVLETMRERFAELVSVEKDGIEQGDFAVIDFTGYIDGQPFPGGAAQGYTLEVGGGSFIPGLKSSWSVPRWMRSGRLSSHSLKTIELKIWPAKKPGLKLRSTKSKKSGTQL